MLSPERLALRKLVEAHRLIQEACRLLLSKDPRREGRHEATMGALFAVDEALKVAGRKIAESPIDE